MRLIHFGMLALVAGCLMACDPGRAEVEEPQRQETEPAACPAETGEFDDLIGQPYLDVQDRFPSGDRKFGLREPGKIYTMVAVFGRTLVYVDEDGVITEIRCG